MNVEDLKIGNPYKYVGRNHKPFKVAYFGTQVNAWSGREYYKFYAWGSTAETRGYLLTSGDVQTFLFPNSMKEAQILKALKMSGVKL